MSTIQNMLDQYKVRLIVQGTPGDGWVGIIEDFLKGMDQLGPWNHEIVQLKEKFGGLRIYLGDSTAEREELVRLAEIRADRTCEWCGAPGTVDSAFHWLLTLCEPCKAKRVLFCGRKPE